VHEGQAVRVSSEGEPPPPEASPDGQGIRGDLHVVIRVDDHELFQRDGDNLILEMPISYTQAVLGADIKIPTLDGEHTLRIEKGTAYGSIFRVEGKGLPNLRTGRRGELLVGVKIEIPKKLTSEQESLLRKLAALENDNVLPESEGFWKKVKEFLNP
jgi:molecular chaperone DnaJ